MLGGRESFGERRCRAVGTTSVCIALGRGAGDHNPETGGPGPQPRTVRIITIRPGSDRCWAATSNRDPPPSRCTRS